MEDCDATIGIVEAKAVTRKARIVLVHMIVSWFMAVVVGLVCCCFAV